MKAETEAEHRQRVAAEDEARSERTKRAVLGATIKDVTVTDLRNKIQAKVEAKIRARGYRKLDELHSQAEDA